MKVAHKVGQSSNEVSKEKRKRSVVCVDQGVQAGDDLIKLAMDRMKLVEKNKHMFFGSGGH